MKVTGDLQRAREYSKCALGLNVAALIIIILTILSLVIVLMIVPVIAHYIWSQLLSVLP